MDLQENLGLSYLLISHDLAVVKHISDIIAVMYLGKIVELGPSEDVYASPLHAYTKALIGSIAIPEPGLSKKKVVLTGDVPSPINPPAGCAFGPGSICSIPESPQNENGFQGNNSWSMGSRLPMLFGK